MATVRAGTHERLGVPVAVKVITGAPGDDVTSSEILIREIRAMASLTHPGIVTVHDYGFVDADASRASGGKLVAGAPYFVMERATQGTLRTRLKRGPRPDYEEVRDILKFSKVSFSECDDIAEQTAKLLSEGKLVGWFQGGMEMGPRARGGRSILAAPPSACVPSPASAPGSAQSTSATCEGSRRRQEARSEEGRRARRRRPRTICGYSISGEHR